MTQNAFFVFKSAFLRYVMYFRFTIFSHVKEKKKKMAKYVARRIRTAPIWYAILLMVIGILLIIGGSGAAESITKGIITVVGVLLAVFGVINAIAGFFVMGVIQILFGILIAVFAWFFYWLCFLILGIVLFASGISRLMRHQGWIVTNIVNLVVGIAIIILSLGFKFEWAQVAVEILYISAGVLLLLDGILILVKRN